MDEQNFSRNWIAQGAAISLFVAGLLHVMIISQHWEHAPAHGIVMGIIGVVEIIWAVPFWFRSTLRFAQLGVIISVGCITLWGITRLLPAPFGHGPEEVDASGIITKAIEGATALALIAVMIRTLPSSKNNSWKNNSWVLRNIVAVILLAVVLGFGAYEAGRAAEPLFPQLYAPETQENDEHGHLRDPGNHAPAHDQGSEGLLFGIQRGTRR